MNEKIAMPSAKEKDEKRKLYADYIFIIIGIIAALRIALEFEGSIAVAGAIAAMLLIAALVYFSRKSKGRKKR